MTAHTTPERRSEARIEAQLLVSYRQPGGEAYDMTRTRNVGPGGMLLTTHREYRRGEALILRLWLPSAERPYDLQGQVVDCLTDGSGPLHLTRVAFMGPDKETFDALSGFAHERLVSGP